MSRLRDLEKKHDAMAQLAATEKERTAHAVKAGDYASAAMLAEADDRDRMRRLVTDLAMGPSREGARQQAIRAVVAAQWAVACVLFWDDEDGGVVAHDHFIAKAIARLPAPEQIVDGTWP